MISKQNVLPNFVRTALVVAGIATSASVFAGDQKKDEAIGQLKDMKKSEHSLKQDELSTSLTDKAGAADAKAMSAEEKKMAEKAQDIKDEAPEG